MTETLPDNQLYPAEYSRRTPLYEVEGHPGSVLRRPFNRVELADSMDRDKVFAELLIDLEEKYGIHSPSMSLFQTTNAHGHPEIFIEGQRVEGKNLSDEASQMPAPVVRGAIEAITKYYQDASVNGGPHLSDLRPSNIIYGRTESDDADHLYFIDLEPLWSNNEARRPLNANDMDRVLPELWLLIKEGISRGEDWQDLLDAYIDFEALYK